MMQVGVDFGFLEEIKKDLGAGREILFRCCDENLWNWNQGSRFIFWRWTKEFRKEARDGTRKFVLGELPQHTKRQK